MLKKFDPDTYDFGGSPERITLHWTGGSYTPSSLDAEHYQFLIDGEGIVYEGEYSVEDQDSTSSNYAAHTRGFNAKNIGVVLCGMAGSEENGTFGEYPLTDKQVTVMAELCALLCAQYGIKPEPEYLASHCEIEKIHGVKQSGKWDISALEWTDLTWTGLNDWFRSLVRDEMAGGAPRTEPPRGHIYLSIVDPAQDVHILVPHAGQVFITETS